MPRPSFFHHLHPPAIPAREARFRYTFGLGGLSLFLFLFLCLTGALELFYYTPSLDAANESVQLITFLVPYGWLVRGLHFWAAQALVVTASLHLLRVVLTGGYKAPRRFNWLLGLGLLVGVLLLDFTGYVLRWDEHIAWALLVGTNLVKSIPLLGAGLYSATVGGAEIGAATVVRFYAWHIFGLALPAFALVVWHAFRVRRDGGIAHIRGDPAPAPPVTRHASLPRNELVRRETLAALVATLVLLALSLLFPPALGPAADFAKLPERPTAPWIFIWLQELLRLGDPFVVGVLVPAGVLALLGLLPYLVDRGPSGAARWFNPEGRWAQLMVLGMAVGWFALTVRGADLPVVGRWGQSRTPQPVELLPSLTGEVEYCLTCHTGIEAVSAAHPTDAFGCVRCHGGERLALDADLAHSTLRGGRNPSDFSVVEQSCGGSDCHSGSPDDQRDHIARALTSVQATYAGAIANVYFTFGGQPDLTARYGAIAVSGRDSSGSPRALAALHDLPKPENPFLQRFLENCTGCHLSAEAVDEPGYHRLTGCAACHSPSNELGTYTGGDPTVTRGEPGHADAHTLTTAIPYTQCNACHNRGNYDLRTMAFNPRPDGPADRLHDYYQPIAQFTRCEVELDCVDCHTAGEAMGDGAIHDSQASVQYVQCKTCHGTPDSLPLTRTITDPDDIALRRAFLNPTVPLQPGDTVVVTEKGEPLWSVRRLADGSFQQIGKATGQAYAVPMVKGSQCRQNPDEQESRYCHACHAVDR